MVKLDPECRNIQTRLVELSLATTHGTLPKNIAVHIESCENCQHYAEGVQSAPLLFHGETLYRSALKHRTLMAVASSNRTGDWKLGILLSVPVALSLLLSFLTQVYLVHLALSKTLGTGPTLWALSIAVVAAFGAAAGFACLAVFVRKHAERKKIQEVFCD
jgi:hypothetical protein